MRERNERVKGPYRHRRKWRAFVIGADGRQRAVGFETEEAARKFIAEVTKQLDTRTIKFAVDAYHESQRERGLRESTVERSEYHLKRVLDTHQRGHLQLRSLTSTLAKRLHSETLGPSVDTNRNGLAAARSFGAWCVERGWLPANPFGSIKGKGRRKRGKPQLRIAEARDVRGICLELGEKGDQGAIATLAYLLLGVRSSELTTRTVRDLDDDGRLLWIPDSKTDAGRRTLEVPDELRPLLLRIAKGRGGAAPLFASSRGRQRGRDWARDQVVRIAKLAGVSRVTPHGLRGTQATIATAAGATAHLVSAALGHQSTAITKASYLDAGTLDVVQRSRTLKVLSGGLK